MSVSLKQPAFSPFRWNYLRSNELTYTWHNPLSLFRRNIYLASNKQAQTWRTCKREVLSGISINYIVVKFIICCFTNHSIIACCNIYHRRMKSISKKIGIVLREIFELMASNWLCHQNHQTVRQNIYPFPPKKWINLTPVDGIFNL